MNEENADSAWVVEYRRWVDDVDSDLTLVGLFASRAAAEDWAKRAWVEGYGPCWTIRWVDRAWRLPLIMGLDGEVRIDGSEP